MRQRLSTLLLMTCLALTPAGRCADGAPAAWTWNGTPVRQALVIEGVWSEFFKVREALLDEGIPFTDGYASKSAYWKGQTLLFNIPADEASFRNYAVVVIENVEASALGPARLALLERFVAAGGGLVVFGGHWSYAGGGYAPTALGKLLPVTWETAGWQVAYLRQPAAEQTLHPAPGADWPMPFAWDAAPRVPYGTHLTPRPGATVQVLMGTRPAIVSGTYGAGRVVAIACAPNGMTTGDGPVYWAWPDWTRLTATAITWAAAARPLATRNTAARPVLTGAMLAGLAIEPRELTPQELQLADSGVDQEAADAILELLAEPRALTPATQARLIPALMPYARPEWGATFARMADTMNPDAPSRSAAIRLLARCRRPEDFPLLCAATRDAAVRAVALESLGYFGDMRALPLLIQHYAASRAACRAQTEGPQWDPAALATHASELLGASAAGTLLLPHEGITEFTRTVADIQLCRRILENAAKARTTDEKGAARAAQLREWAAALRTEERRAIGLGADILRQHPAEARDHMNGLSDETALRFWGAALLAGATPGATAMDYNVFENLRPPYLRRLAAMLRAPAP